MKNGSQIISSHFLTRLMATIATLSLIGCVAVDQNSVDDLSSNLADPSKIAIFAYDSSLNECVNSDGIVGMNSSTNAGQCTDMSSRDLTGLDLSNKDLRGASFARSNLSMSNLSGSNLEGASFENADLTNAKLEGAIVHQANFSNARLNSPSAATPAPLPLVSNPQPSSGIAAAPTPTPSSTPSALPSSGATPAATPSPTPVSVIPAPSTIEAIKQSEELADVIADKPGTTPTPVPSPSEVMTPDVIAQSKAEIERLKLERKPILDLIQVDNQMISKIVKDFIEPLKEQIAIESKQESDSKGKGKDKDKSASKHLENLLAKKAQYEDQIRDIREMRQHERERLRNLNKKIRELRKKVSDSAKHYYDKAKGK